MDITWLGHSAVRIQSGQVTVVTDPYRRASDGKAMPDTQADIVTISHDHPRHDNARGVEGSPRVLRGPGEYEIANFYISGIGTPHTPPNKEEADVGAPRQVNTVYAMRAEGLNICHAGAIVPALTPRQLDELNNTEVLIVNAGSDPAEVTRAARLINQISPRIVIPVGYMVADADSAASAIAPLLGELGVAEATPQPSLRVSTTNLPRDTRVVALRPLR